MRIFKIMEFDKWAKKQIADSRLIESVNEMENGLFDSNLGGNVYKKRIAAEGKGKSSSFRTIVTFKSKEKIFFLYGFAKNKKSNITQNELKGLKVYARYLFSRMDIQIEEMINLGELIEIIN